MTDISNSSPLEQPEINSSLDSQDEIPVRKDLVLSYISINFLKEIAKWTKFISIVGFVLVGFMVLAGISVGAIMGMIGSMIPSELSNEAVNFNKMPGAFGSLFGFIYIVMAAFYFFPVYYLYNFSTKLKNAIHLNSELILDKSFQNLKSHYKFIGVLLIVVLGIYALAFVVFGGIAMVAGLM